MLSLNSRRGGSRRCRIAARALGLCLAMLAVNLSSSPSPSPAARVPGGEVPLKRAASKPAPPAAAPAAVGVADPDKALQQLAEEAERIDPAAQDAVSRLRAVVRGLIEVERARAREIAALRATKRTRSASSGSRKRSRKAASPAAPGAPLSPPAGTASEPDQTAAAAPNPATAGMLFGKRGLKKVHRPGCVFGERIRAEDRVYFKRLEEATAAGYEPCKICRPGG